MNHELDIEPLASWGIFTEKRPCIVAGPCSAESEEQVMETALGLKAAGVTVLRAGLWKPRTHPGSFEGAGSKGLEWLKRVRDELGMKVCTEVAGRDHVEECLDAGIDMVWLGARTTTNPFLVQEIAGALEGTGIPVMVKNPVNNDIDLWLGAIERLNAAGVRKIAAVHRGVTPITKSVYRNDPQWHMALQLRSACPQLPFFCDPSHMGGSPEYLPEISQKALDLGLDGLMIEVHSHPEMALTDARQQITPGDLQALLASLKVRKSNSEDAAYNRQLDSLRTQIDYCDDCLLDILSRRMEASRSIGQIKKEHNIAILQASRWSYILGEMIEKGTAAGLPEDFVRSIFNTIHEASVQTQDEIMKSDEH